MFSHLKTQREGLTLKMMRDGSYQLHFRREDMEVHRSNLHVYPAGSWRNQVKSSGTGSQRYNMFSYWRAWAGLILVESFED